MELLTMTGGLFVLRWIHFLAGVTWIGVLYYINFIQTPFFAAADPAVRNSMIRGLVPNALWWFSWGAMFTFLTGWLIVAAKVGHGGASMGYYSLILTGGIMGSLMWANVWFVIRPAQKIVIASAEQVAAGGEALPEAAARGQRAGLASRTNTLFSIPMLFFMGSASHFTQLIARQQPGYGTYLILALIVIVAVEINALARPGLPTQKPLASVSGTIHSGIVLTVVLYLLAHFIL
jgi:uncharacterized membrane protein